MTSSPKLVNKLLGRSYSSPKLSPSQHRVEKTPSLSSLKIEDNTSTTTTTSSIDSEQIEREQLPIHIDDQRYFLVRDRGDGLFRVLEFFDDGLFIHIPYDEVPNNNFVEFDPSTLATNTTTSNTTTTNSTPTPNSPDEASSSSNRKTSNIPNSPLTVSEKWKLWDIVLITDIKNCISVPERTEVFFDWNRPKDRDKVLVRSIYETPLCVNLETKYKNIIKHHVEVLQKGEWGVELLPRRVIEAPSEFIQQQLPFTYYHPFEYTNKDDLLKVGSVSTVSG
eukprot:TRINITY_DN1007_c0_g1_i1.p1 TRINITY_DN1007_c0_g1~~TRINITY_DN1007_c0_g1_i1.p1  ORF type:complete len:279 (-),score=51.89 TRINITY_DN1007_c0_g1_i1:125-961(-)